MLTAVKRSGTRGTFAPVDGTFSRGPRSEVLPPQTCLGGLRRTLVDALRRLRNGASDSSVPRALVSATGRGTFALAWPQWPSCSRRRCPKPSAPSRDLTMYRGTFLCAAFSGGSSRRSVRRRHLHRASRGRISRRACRTTRAAPRPLQERRCITTLSLIPVRAAHSTRKQPYLLIAIEFCCEIRYDMTPRAPYAVLHRNPG